MSKKLLMNSFSGGSSEGLTPVQNGLVCWLDAFDLTSFAYNITWHDRTSNRNNGTLSSESGELGNGYIQAKGVVNIPNPTKGLNEYTVEIGYEDVALKYWCGLWGNTSKAGNSPDGVSFYQQENRIMTYPLNITVPDKTNLQGGKNYVTVTFSSIDFKIYINGEFYFKKVYDDGGTVYPSKANYFCFMSRKPNTVDEDTNTGADSFENKWYFLRIYNRTLTEEEIFNNYNYELSLKRG